MQQKRPCTAMHGGVTRLIKKAERQIAALLAVVLVAFCAATDAYALGTEDICLIPSGETVGIGIETDGVIVANVVQIETENGPVSPAHEAGILPGDIITRIGAVKIDSAETLKNIVTASEENSLTVRVIRGGKEMQLTVTPHRSTDGEPELGMWLRDRIAGLGTVTWIDAGTGAFGALGHPVSDIDTGIIVPVRTGTVSPADVTGIITGRVGTPGQLQGSFDLNNPAGTVTANTKAGIFGTLDERPDGTPLPICTKDEVEVGNATIMSSIGGEGVRSYSIEILHIYSGNDESGRCMMISVTDEELIALTGGIVQGMSGSPIIQDGKLVGAVTHVLVNDPTRGYGIFIENMLDAAK